MWPKEKNIEASCGNRPVFTHQKFCLFNNLVAWVPDLKKGGSLGTSFLLCTKGAILVLQHCIDEVLGGISGTPCLGRSPPNNIAQKGKEEKQRAHFHLC